MKVLRYVGQIGSMDESYRAALADGERVVIDSLPKGANTLTRFEINGSPLHITPDPHSRDLLDLAAAMYIADEMAPRAEADDEWTRSFEFVYPVMDPARWEEAAPTLRRCLRKLSGDEFTFAWPARTKIPGLGSHRSKLPRGYDAVCLFSGGIDSLLGAFRLVADGKKVLLVGHQADGTAASAQTQLAAALRQNFPKQVALVQCRVSRGWTANPRFPLPEKCEDTHRPRSFLFLGVAIAVANAAGIGEVYIPENGLIALNPPLQISRIGSLSTRTAHPIFLTRYLDFVAGAQLFGGSIRNPFLYQSKTDMLRELDPALTQAVVRSVSCARPQRYKDRGVRHCGYCVPCIYRRVSLMAAGLDRASDYAFDVYNDLPVMTPTTQADFKALVQFARRVVSATPAKRDLIVLAHGYFPHDVGERVGPSRVDDYSPWSEMLLRWAGDFLDRLDALASGGTLEIVGLSGSARRVQPA